jgi:hypothetical protein
VGWPSGCLVPEQDYPYPLTDAQVRKLGLTLAAVRKGRGIIEAEFLRVIELARKILLQGEMLERLFAGRFLVDLQDDALAFLPAASALPEAAWVWFRGEFRAIEKDEEAASGPEDYRNRSAGSGGQG